MSKQYLIEMNLDGLKQFATDELNENTGSMVKNYYIQGVFTVAEKYNRNGRWYPKNTCNEAILNYKKEFIDTGTAYGEIMHPESLIVDLSKSAVLITKYEIQQPESPIFIGKAKVLSTPQGQIIKALINDGGNFGVSTRGEGALNQISEGYQVADWVIMAVDVVGTPSVAEAMMDRVYENKLNEYFNRDIINSYKKTTDKIITSTFDVKDRNEKFVKLWIEMMNQIKVQK